MLANNITSAESTAIPNEFNFASERMTRPIAAEYLGVSLEFLEADAFSQRHKIPYIKVGSKVFYLKSDLDAWVMAHRIGGAI